MLYVAYTSSTWLEVSCWQQQLECEWNAKPQNCEADARYTESHSLAHPFQIWSARNQRIRIWNSLLLYLWKNLRIRLHWMQLLANNFSLSGTTWITEIVRNVLYIRDNDILEKAKRLQQFFIYLEYGPGRYLNYVNELTGRNECNFGILQWFLKQNVRSLSQLPIFPKLPKRFIACTAHQPFH